MRKTVIL